MATDSTNASILFGEDAFRYLITHANEEEASASAYWREHKDMFDVGNDGIVKGTQVLGNVNNKRSFLHDTAHRILQLPLKRFARQYGSLVECERIGRDVAHRRRQQFTYDTLRHVFTLAMIRHYRAEVVHSGNTLVIGDGYGTMSSLLLLSSKDNRICLANLTKPLALDLAYLRRAFPDTPMALVRNESGMQAALADDALRVIAVQADNCQLLRNVSIGLAVNIVSMQEMDLPVVTHYFDILRNNPAPSTLFYCCNRRFKTSNFEEYPWREGDLVLEEGICEWSQHYYSTRPPFLHKRHYGDKVVLHRLAELEKDNG